MGNVMSRSQKSKNVLLVIIVLTFIALIGAVGYLYKTNKDLKYELSLSEQERTDRKNQQLIADVGKLMNLPDEEPVIVLVNDPAKAEEENPGIKEIFDDLQKDDYILIFKKEKLGVQYRPSQNKIIKSTTINLPITVEIIGTQADITATKKSLEQFGNQLSVIETVNTTITDSAIYDVDNNQQAEVQSLDELLKFGITNTLPNTVTANSQAEIVILVAPSSTTQAAPTQP
jgi:hypothetical protein